MLFTTLALLYLPCLVLGKSLNTYYSSSEVCTTGYSTKAPKNPVKTTKSTKTLPPNTVHYTSTTTPCYTYTPAPTTQTSYHETWVTSKTTNSACPNTYYTTKTYYVTDTAYTTETKTETQTSKTTTCSYEYSTVPTPGGYIPAYDSCDQQSFSKNKKRFAEAALVGSLSGRAERVAVQARDAKPKYTTGVTCVNTVQPYCTDGVTSTAPPTYVTIAPPTQYTDVTTIKTSMSTMCPSSVSKTMKYSTTIYYTVISTKYATETSKTTETVYQTCSTSVYAACATNNLLGPKLKGGKYPNGVYEKSSGKLGCEQDHPENSAYDCCVSCFEADGCQFSRYHPSADSKNTCEHYTTPGGVGGYGGEVANFNMTDEATDYVYSNGPCGSLGLPGMAS